ncbi:MAG: PQQ-binding-like beta-propeller repeat protein [Planctomycetota bacterium]
MHRTRTTKRLLLMACGPAWAATLVLAGQAVADEAAEAEALPAAEGVIKAEALAEAELAVEMVEEAVEDPGLDLTYQPGFSFVLADDDLQKQIAQLSKFIKEADWAKAFRLLTELNSDTLQAMVPLGSDGQHVLVKEELQRQLLSLPPDGRRAFQLYFDGQAGEQFEKIKNHPLPGSDDQLIQTQALVDRLLASSVGGEAAVLLGDMYFERGLFSQADRYWGLALEQGSATGKAALALQAKRAIAMQRAGKLSEAQSLYDGLAARYSQATIQAGGEEIDALAMIGQMLEVPSVKGPVQDANDKPTGLLPAPDASPHWHLRFLERKAQNAVNQVRGRGSWYQPPGDLVKFVPPVVADKERVYFQWLGAAFALDRASGKIVWKNGQIQSKADTVVNRVQSNQGDPRNYTIAISEDTLLVTSPLNDNREAPFTLRAYEASTGIESWSSSTRNDWTITKDGKAQETATSVLGRVLIADGWGYAIVYRSGQNTLHLRRFNPSTGEVDFTIPLGSAEVIAFQYTQVNRMPQPQMLMGRSLLYVMTNNGALIAVDVIGNEIKWALKMDPPFGIGQSQTNTNAFGRNQLGPQIQQMANTNGSGHLLLQGGRLYAKEHNGRALYAVEPETGKVAWKAGQLKPDAKFLGIDAERFYLMDRALQSYDARGSRDLITKNGAQTGSPDHSGAIMLDDTILVYASNRLRKFDKKHLDPAGKYENFEFLGNKGGLLYHFGDLLIAIDTAEITAFKITNENN